MKHAEWPRQIFTKPYQHGIQHSSFNPALFGIFGASNAYLIYIVLPSILNVLDDTTRRDLQDLTLDINVVQLEDASRVLCDRVETSRRES
jgi:hypothetical protein